MSLLLVFGRTCRRVATEHSGGGFSLRCMRGANRNTEPSIVAKRGGDTTTRCFGARNVAYHSCVVAHHTMRTCVPSGLTRTDHAFLWRTTLSFDATSIGAAAGLASPLGGPLSQRLMICSTPVAVMFPHSVPRATAMSSNVV